MLICRPVGAFSKSRTEIRSMDSRVSARDLPTYLREAERGYRWRSVPAAAVPGFGELLGFDQVGGFPWRKYGTSTPVVMRSVLHRGDIHACSNVWGC